MLPKSVCFPSAVRRSEGGWGGDFMSRIWSPDGVARAWRDWRVLGGRWRWAFR
jgi:hypothetical protein